MKQHNQLDSFFEIVAGFIDTLHIMRDTLSRLSTHTLGALATHFGINTEGAHDALEDVRILEKIVERAEISNLPLRIRMRSIPEVALGGALPWNPHRKYGLLTLTSFVSDDLIRNLAQRKITLEVLQMTSRNDAEFEALVSPILINEKQMHALKKAVRQSILRS